VSKVKLTRRAAEERVRRHLNKSGVSLRKDRKTGEYFGIEENGVAFSGQPLDQLVSRCKVLKPWEVVA
jgi:hypothetical protein